MKRISLAALAVLALAACETTNTSPDGRTQAAQAAASVNAIAAFEPQPSGTRASIDYSLVNEFLDAAVINLGPSTRKLAPPPRNPTNTRVKIGHQSRLRLEGNKIPFSQFDRDTREAVDEYAQSLVAIGNATDITKLSKNEQLAYWFNLHNMLVIAEIAKQYPVRNPSAMRVDGVPLHEAKLATINGVALSPRDIRIGIVYAYWGDPRVMYGFFHGDLASPSIQTDAWDPRFLNRDLGRNAKEFINSLRGVDKRGNQTLLVSPLYDEARDTLFPKWPGDFKDHLLDYADNEVAELINNRPVIEFGPYEERIADLAGGQPYESISPTQTPFADPRLQNLPLSVQGMIADVSRKFQSPEFRARRRGGTVTIIDSDQIEEDTGTVE
ncbi:MAG: DUF547 domain-containing protein [Pseudomonadota bacterium]